MTPSVLPITTPIRIAHSTYSILGSVVWCAAPYCLIASLDPLAGISDRKQQGQSGQRRHEADQEISARRRASCVCCPALAIEDWPSIGS